MKKLIALCLLLALLCGCNVDTIEPAQTEPSETTQVTEEPVAVKERGEFGMTYLPAYGLNPLSCSATINRASFSLLYESLFVVSNQFRAEPVLCDGFRVSDDAMTYTFSLVQGVRFSDGSALTAQDVKVSLEAAKKSPFYKARLKDIRALKVLSDGSLEVSLKTPYENFCLMLDVPILKADTVAEDYPIGTGPYVKSGEALLRNSHWWQSQTVAIDDERIPLSASKTTNDIRDSFEFGTSDLVYCDPNSPAAVGYRCDYEVWEAPTTIMHYIGFNLGSGYFANDTVRAAVTYAIDRNDISNVVYGGFAQASTLPCSPSSDLYDTALSQEYDHAPARFAAAVNNSGILSRSDYQNHVGYFLVCNEDPKRVEAAEYIAQALNGAGLNIVVTAKDRDEYEKALKSGSFDLYYGEVRLTANFDLSEFFGGELAYGRLSAKDLSALCAGALANSGSYVELCSQIMSEGLLCPVVFKSYAAYVTRGMIGSITPAVDFLFHNAATARTLSDADRTYEETAE